MDSYSRYLAKGMGREPQRVRGAQRHAQSALRSLAAFVSVSSHGSFFAKEHMYALV
jgi:hypothetical protein